MASPRAQTSVEITALTTFAPLSAFEAHIRLNLAVITLFGARSSSALQSAVAHLKVKCGKMLTSLLSQHHGRCRRARAAVSLSISLCFSFTLWMVHLAHKTE